MTLERKTRNRLFRRTATLDHVFTRGDPRRSDVGLAQQIATAVASCYECNNKRGDTPFEDFYRQRYASQTDAP